MRLMTRPGEDAVCAVAFSTQHLRSVGPVAAVFLIQTVFCRGRPRLVGIESSGPDRSCDGLSARAFLDAAAALALQPGRCTT